MEAEFQNQLIKMKNFRFPAPEVDFFKINLGGITFQIQSEIAEQTAAKTAVEVMLEHVMQHVKHIFRWRQYRIGLTVEFHERWFQMTGGKNFVHQFIGPGKLINTDDAVMEFQRKGAARHGKKHLFREYKDPDLPASDIREWDNWRRD